MPWKESTCMSSRKEFIRFALQEGANIRRLCRHYGISPKTGYKWLKRYQEQGEAVAEYSRRPHHSPSLTGPEIEQRVIAYRDEHPAWGGRKLYCGLVKKGYQDTPSPATITAILHRHGRISPEASAQRTPWQRFEASRPNALWQMDFKSPLPMVADHRRYCHPLTVLDDHSRFSLGVFACAGQTYQAVREHLTTIFRTYGLPERLLADNGQPWGSPTQVEHYSSLEVWLLRLAVPVSHARIRHPQTCGKDERFHATFAAEVLRRQLFTDMEHCQDIFDRWRMVYNFERPHEALAMQVPADRYRPSGREYPEHLPAIEYPSGDMIRMVQSNGDITFGKKIFRIGMAFGGFPVALRPTTIDGTFDVFFCYENVARINLAFPTRMRS